MQPFSRRSFLAGAAATAFATPAAADIACSSFNDFGHRQCTVGLLNVPSIQQQCQQWCWAACAELAFRMQGIDIDQTTFVERVFGNANVCLPATGQQIAQAVSGQWTDKYGQPVSANLGVILDYDHNIQNTNDPMRVVRDELEANRVVIAGTLGHAICITAMDYLENYAGQRQLVGLTVRDPWPWSQNKYQMSLQQFNAGRFLATVNFT